MKYFLLLSYKGTRYHGWQRQAHKPTVQGAMEDALQLLLGRKVSCIGCGRTDAGVHASGYVCHIKVAAPFDFDPVFRLNKLLPHDISIIACQEAPPGAHAQRDALARTYVYRIHTVKNALLSELSAWYPAENLDVEKLHAAAALIPQYKDFRGMCRQPDLKKSTVCEVAQARWSVSDDSRQLEFTITANRFLKNMVRILVGKMLEVAYGRMTLEAFEDVLKTGRPPKHFNAAFPQGLYLEGVAYDFLAG
jgi:tRNA pseudouridine38-40 synthase